MRKLQGTLKPQGRVTAALKPAPVISGLPEAPKDGRFYGRKDGAWAQGAALSVNGALPDAQGNIDINPGNIAYGDKTLALALAGIEANFDNYYTKGIMDGEFAKYYTAQEIDAKIAAVYHFKGSVDAFADLPAGASVGDVYDVLDSGANYAWDGEAWDHIGGLTAWGSIAGDIEDQDDLITLLGGYFKKTDVIPVAQGGTGNAAGKAAAAAKLETARTVSITSTGTSLDVSTPTPPSFDGSGNLTIPITVKPPDSAGGGITLTSNVITTASTQASMSTSYGAGTALNVTTGLTAGTRTLQNLLQEMVNKIHGHTTTAVNCNCTCSGTCG
ncbi:MAG: hypothetical protein LBP78_06655 [Acidaminococcales bacterium]|jgi:hypothetical protein|nr:hypothetical protein [Acidaminococcales bacterium]